VSDLSYNWFPSSDQCERHCEGTFVDGLINNDEKVASSKKPYHLLFKTRVENHTLLETKMAKIDALFLTKTAKKQYRLGLHIPV